MEHLIDNLELLPGRKIRLRFSSGEITKDFSPIIGAGGVFARLADDDYWSQAVIADGGRALAWPAISDDEVTALDFCAEALWFEAHPTDYRRYLDHVAATTAEPTALTR